MKRIFLLGTIPFLTLFGCATQGYEGPKLPSSQTSKVHFQTEGRLSIKNMTIDGVKQSIFDMAISVPSGEHKATTGYQLDMKECPMFSVGCMDEVFLGRCEFTFPTQSGHDYTIELKGAGEAVISHIYDNSNNESVGSGECSNDKEDFHTSVLRRRSTIGE